MTLLSRAKSAEVLKTRMDGFLDQAVKPTQREETTGKCLDMEVSTWRRRTVRCRLLGISHGRSARAKQFADGGSEQVLASIQGKGRDGKAVRRLGDSAEFRYIRTLMPRGAKEEDGSCTCRIRLFADSWGRR